MIMPKYTISDSNLHIADSYKVPKREFKKTLEAIESSDPLYIVWVRSKTGMCLEWATHNALYALGIKRSSTKDVDLNYPQKWYEALGYGIVGTLVWIFIK